MHYYTNALLHQRESFKICEKRVAFFQNIHYNIDKEREIKKNKKCKKNKKKEERRVELLIKSHYNKDVKKGRH